MQSFCLQPVISAKLSPARGKNLLVCSSTFLWRFFCSGLETLCPFLQRKSTVLCSFSQQRIFPALTVAYWFSLFPLHSLIVSWRSVGTNAKCHILLSVSPVLNGQVLPSSYLYEISLCLFMQRSWLFFITHTHSRISHWFALTLENLNAPGVTPFQLMPSPQFCSSDLYSAFVFIHEHLVTLQHISLEWAQLTSWPKSLHTTARSKYPLWARLSMWFVSASYGMVGVKPWA